MKKIEIKDGEWNEKMIDRYNLIGYYDRMSRVNKFLDLKRFNIMRGFLKRGSVLELGSGEGIFIGSLTVHQRRVGIDLSKRLVNISKSKYPKVEFIVGDVRNIKIKEKFDNIVCSEVLEHVEECDKVVKEAFRLLKDDGIFIVSVPDESVRLFAKKIFKKFGILNRLSVCNDLKNECHIHNFNEKSIVELIEANDFKVMSIRKIPLSLFPVNYILKFCKRKII